MEVIGVRDRKMKVERRGKKTGGVGGRRGDMTYYDVIGNLET